MIRVRLIQLALTVAILAPTFVSAEVSHFSKSSRVFQLTLTVPIDPDQTERCQTAVVRTINRSRKKLRFLDAELLVYRYSAGVLQSINGIPRGQPRRTLSLLDAAGRLASTGVLDRQTIDLCDGNSGDNRIAAILRYTTVGGQSGRLSLGRSTCVRGKDEACDIVDHDLYPTGAAPLRAIDAAACIEPAYSISVSSSRQLCVDGDVFPRISLLSVDSNVACPAGTAPISGGYPSDRKLCTTFRHATALQWIEGSRVPQSVRSSQNGSPEYVPVSGAAYSPWYLRVSAPQVTGTTTFERITTNGAVAYSITLAGSRGKLPELSGGRWKAVEGKSFLAHAYRADNAVRTIYCGVDQLNARCSSERSTLNEFEHVIESMTIASSSAERSTSVLLLGDNVITTQQQLDAGDVASSIQNLPRTTLGHTATARASAPSSWPFTVSSVVNGLERPWSVAVLPNGDLLITEKPGRLRLVRDGILDPVPVAGLPAIHVYRQAGLLDVVLDPDFRNNRRIYFSYAAGNSAIGYGTEVMRAELRGRRLVNSRRIFVAEPKVQSNPHFGSRLAFDSAGHLFITLGDRGRRFWAQDLGKHPGSIVRINPDGSVPDDNPFVNVPGARPEIYSYGHRNPQGLTVDLQTGQVWASEHGPQGGDEVNLIRPGANFGWPLLSFGEEYSGEPISENYSGDGMADPSWYWTPSIAPSGLAFYSDSAITAFRQSLLAGGLKGQLVSALKTSGSRVVSETAWLEGEAGRVRDIKAGPRGSLYVLIDSTDGRLLRLDPR